MSYLLYMRNGFYVLDVLAYFLRHYLKCLIEAGWTFCRIKTVQLIVSVCVTMGHQ